MKLITEMIDRESIEVICESYGEHKKVWKIRGPMLQAEVRNRNGRIYPTHIIEREVSKYSTGKIATKSALGELDHPPTPSLNLDRVSHLIEDLKMDGNIAVGTAKILDTPMGKIAQALLEAGVKLGVSSRGLGTLGANNMVNEDFGLLCIDIVGDPSAQIAYVDGILESKEWMLSGDSIVEASVEKLRKSLDKNGSKVIRESLSQFLKEIRSSL